MTKIIKLGKGTLKVGNKTFPVFNVKIKLGKDKMKCPLCNQEMEETETEHWSVNETWICMNKDCYMGRMAVSYEPGGTWKVLSEKGEIMKRNFFK